jgi:hypothetical protein
LILELVIDLAGKTFQGIGALAIPAAPEKPLSVPVQAQTAAAVADQFFHGSTLPEG